MALLALKAACASAFFFFLEAISERREASSWGPFEEGEAERLDFGMGIELAEERIKLAFKKQTRGRGSAGLGFESLAMFKVALN